MLTVADVMRRHVYQVSPDTSIGAAARQLIVHGVESLLVVQGGQLVGIVSERDVLASTLPTIEDLVSSEGATGFLDVIDFARERAGTPVSSVMTRPVESIAPSASITKALGKMLSRRLRRLPVLDPSTGELRGIVTQRDLLNVIFVGDSRAASHPA